MKRRIIGFGLVLFAVWPLVHRGLVAGYGIDPWKLAGWAMYTRPSFAPRVEVLVPGANGPEAIPAARFSQLELGRVAHFVNRRQTLGELASPEPVVHALLEGHPELPGLVVRITRFRLDERAHIAPQSEDFAYRRTADGEVVPVAAGVNATDPQPAETR